MKACIQLISDQVKLAAPVLACYQQGVHVAGAVSKLCAAATSGVGVAEAVFSFGYVPRDTYHERLDALCRLAYPEWTSAVARMPLERVTSGGASDRSLEVETFGAHATASRDPRAASSTVAEPNTLQEQQCTTRRSRVLRACMRTPAAGNAPARAFWPSLRRYTLPPSSPASRRDLASTPSFRRTPELHSRCESSQGSAVSRNAAQAGSQNSRAAAIGRATIGATVRSAVGSLLGLGAEVPSVACTPRAGGAPCAAPDMSAASLSQAIDAAGEAAAAPSAFANRRETRVAQTSSRAQSLSGMPSSPHSPCRRSGIAGRHRSNARSRADMDSAADADRTTSACSASSTPDQAASHVALQQRSYMVPPVARSPCPRTLRRASDAAVHAPLLAAPEAGAPLPPTAVSTSGMHAQLNAVEAQLLGAQSVLQSMAAQLAVAQQAHAEVARDVGVLHQARGRRGAPPLATVAGRPASAGGNGSDACGARDAARSIACSSSSEAGYMESMHSASLLSSHERAGSSWSEMSSAATLQSASESFLSADDFWQSTPGQSNRSSSDAMSDSQQAALPLSSRMDLAARDHHDAQALLAAASADPGRMRRPRSSPSSVSDVDDNADERDLDRSAHAAAASSSGTLHISEVLRQQRLRHRGNASLPVAAQAASPRLQSVSGGSGGDAAAASPRDHDRAVVPAAMARFRAPDSGVPPMSAPFYDFLLRSTRLLLPQHLRTPPVVGPPAAGLHGTSPADPDAPTARWAPRALATIRSMTPKGGHADGALCGGRTFHGHLVGAPQEVLARAPEEARVDEALLVDMARALPGVDVEASIVHSVLDALQGRATCCRMAAVWFPTLQIAGAADRVWTPDGAAGTGEQEVCKLAAASLVQLDEAAVAVAEAGAAP